jgi:uncharacterized membrane protein
MSASPSSPERTRNWTAFAAVMFLVVGLFNVIDGIAAISRDRHFRADELIVGNLRLWGIVFLIVGAAQLLTTVLIYRRSGAGQVLGVFLAVTSMVATLFFVGAYPVWSIIILVIDGVVIYALTVYGESLDA